MVNSNAVDYVKKFMNEGDSLSVAIKKASAYFENSKVVETELAKHFTAKWNSDFVE